MNQCHLWVCLDTFSNAVLNTSSFLLRSSASSFHSSRFFSKNSLEDSQSLLNHAGILDFFFLSIYWAWTFRGEGVLCSCWWGDCSFGGKLLIVSIKSILWIQIKGLCSYMRCQTGHQREQVLIYNKTCFLPTTNQYPVGLLYWMRGM